MEKELITQLKELFTPIAEKIGQGAEFGWEVVVRQQLVEAYVDIFSIMLGGILLLSGVYLATRTDWDDSTPRWNELTSIACFIIAVPVLLVGFIDFFSTGIGQLLNPEFYAIQFFIELVK